MSRCDRLAAAPSGADLALALRGRCDALLAQVVRGGATWPPPTAPTWRTS